MNVSKVLAALEPSDFDPRESDATGIEALSALGDEIRARELGSCFNDVFLFMERLDDCDLGNPGPLVHALEAVGGYEEHLFASLERKPTPLTLWMLNRIINVASETEKPALMRRLEASATHSNASESARQDATHFLRFQSGED